MAPTAQVNHRFRGRKGNPKTQTLIIGTFNPETPQNEADFFYGRPQNHLWKLLPLAFGENSLKRASLEQKQQFIDKHHIGFVDLINGVAVEPGQEANYSDDYLDSRVVNWNNVISIMVELHDLKRVCFTRRTLSGVPNIRAKVEEVEQYCSRRGVAFKRLLTPSRIYSAAKQEEWTDFLISKF